MHKMRAILIYEGYDRRQYKNETTGEYILSFS